MPVAWGIAGFGWVAADYMAPAITAAGDSLVAVADPSPKARAAAQALGASGVATVEELAALPEVEAIYIATPNHLHQRGGGGGGRQPQGGSLRETHRLDPRRCRSRGCERAGVLFGAAFDQPSPGPSCAESGGAEGADRPDYGAVDRALRAMTDWARDGDAIRRSLDLSVFAVRGHKRFADLPAVALGDTRERGAVARARLEAAGFAVLYIDGISTSAFFLASARSSRRASVGSVSPLFWLGPEVLETTDVS